MILEAIVTTLGPEGAANVAPMGPEVEGPSLERFLLRPFRTSNTCANLEATGEGVLHVVDDVLLLARAALGLADDSATRPARGVRGVVLLDACRYHEFRVVSREARGDRAGFRCETVESGRLRDDFGLNRAKHAVVEAAILATRVHLIPPAEILAEFALLEVLVDKTGGPAERAAFDLLRDHVRAAQPITTLT